MKLKGFDLLIESMGQLPQSLNVRLAIVGDGIEHVPLQDLISRKGLDTRVLLTGYQENPWKYIARADVFVLSSLTEGFPNVIMEALTLGKAVVATDCSAGVRESLHNGLYGLLVPPGDVGALAGGLKRLLVDANLRQQFSERTVEGAAHFGLKAASRAYENLLETVTR